MKTISIAIDGPSGAGKSTLAKSVSKTLGYLYVDTGAIYRTIGYAAFSKGVAPKDGEAVAALLPELEIGLHYEEDGLRHMTLNGTDVTDQIRLPEISLYASAVSAHPAVRAHLLEMQRKLARENNVVMDGRDIGTVVLPDATVKIFLTASVEERAMRRFRELEQRGTPESYEKVLEEMRQRDYNDSHRAPHPCVRRRTPFCWTPRSWTSIRARKRSSGSSARGRADERERTRGPEWIFSSDLLSGCQVDLPSAASGHGSGLGEPAQPRRAAGAESCQQLGPSGAGGAKVPMDCGPCHGQEGAHSRNPFWHGHAEAGRIPREPGRRGYSGGEDHHPDHPERPQSADLPGGTHHIGWHHEGAACRPTLTAVRR